MRSKCIDMAETKAPQCEHSCVALSLILLLSRTARLHLLACYLAHATHSRSTCVRTALFSSALSLLTTHFGVHQAQRVACGVNGGLIFPLAEPAERQEAALLPDGHEVVVEADVPELLHGLTRLVPRHARQAAILDKRGQCTQQRASMPSRLTCFWLARLLPRDKRSTKSRSISVF